MTRYPAFIVRAAEAKLRDALDLANDRLLRYQDENVRLTRENLGLKGEVRRLQDSLQTTAAKWQQAAAERDVALKHLNGGPTASKKAPDA